MLKRPTMLSIILLLCAAFLKTATSTEPTVAIACRGERQYIDEDGHCRTCEKCPPGTQIHGGCGYGKRDYDYKCVECADGHFTATAGYNVCVVCTPCQTWKTVYDVECTPTHNSVCGSCIQGYYRRSLRGEGIPDEICLPCSESTKDQPDCMEAGDFPWPTFAIVGWSAFICMVVLLIVGIGYLRHRKRRKSARKRRRCDGFSDVTPTSSPINASQSLGDSRSELSVIEMDPVKPSFPIVSHIDEVAPPAKIEATTPFLPSVRSGYSCHTPAEHYSNMPTAQFGSNALSNHGPTPSNMPTKLYDETHPSHITNVAALPHHNNAIMMPPPNIRPPRRHRNEFTSHRNLMDHMDSDNKLLGQTHEPLLIFEPESFDTASDAGENTRPHKNMV